LEGKVEQNAGTHIVATICPLAEGEKFMSLIIRENKGEKVNKEAMKYAMAHLRILRYIIDRENCRQGRNENHEGFTGVGGWYVDAIEE
jgi:hypothetical protein